MRSLRDSARVSECLRRFSVLSPDSPRQWGKMTVNQMVCHLTDGFRMATGERPIRDASSWFQRTALKGIALYLPVPWPKVYRHSQKPMRSVGERGRPSSRRISTGWKMRFDDSSPRRPQVGATGIRCSAPCRRSSGSAGATCTPTITCGSSTHESRLGSATAQALREPPMVTRKVGRGRVESGRQGRGTRRLP